MECGDMAGCHTFLSAVCLPLSDDHQPKHRFACTAALLQAQVPWPYLEYLLNFWLVLNGETPVQDEAGDVVLVPAKVGAWWLMWWQALSTGCR